MISTIDCLPLLYLEVLTIKPTLKYLLYNLCCNKRHHNILLLGKQRVEEDGRRYSNQSCYPQVSNIHMYIIYIRERNTVHFFVTITLPFQPSKKKRHRIKREREKCTKESYRGIEQKGMTFDHDFGYSFPLFSSLLKNLQAWEFACLKSTLL